ncbi:beta-galactosidase-1-like protein 2 isoform X2 [Artemia franciscana]|uniref:beta-galactosidase-1-like protein 2 isoform X2 n=1 Tax=Artemia franciscana TaxID=6661 RepID=UPI0032DA6505
METVTVAAQDLPSNYQYYTEEGVKSGLEWTNGAFLLNKKGFRIFSGAVHYFRVHPDYWRDRLKKVRAAGLTTVETYVPWNLHEKTKDSFDFGDGQSEMSPFLDIVRFVKMAKEEDLFVIVRPGPYICSEWDYGGLPSWLQRDPSMRVRTSYPGYLERVDKFFGMLLPLLTDLQFTRNGSIIAWQVENEYGNYQEDVDRAYMEYLRDKMIELGVIETLFTSDTPTLSGDLGSVEGAIQSANFQYGAAKEFARLQELQPGGPNLVMEFWTGWFDHWGEPWHNTHNPEDMASELSVILSDEWYGNVNFYMFHGGTSFGFLNGANVPPISPQYMADVSSYDYDAVLTEAGDYTPKYTIIREMILPNLPPIYTPEPPELKSKANYRGVVLTEYVSLENLVRNVPGELQFTGMKLPLAMEDLPMNNDSGQSFGYILYRTTAEFGSGSNLTIVGHVRDLAVLRIDGKLLSKPWTSDSQIGSFGFWGAANRSYTFEDVEYGAHVIDILVENMGRNNFGVLSDFNQKKGLPEGPVLLDDVDIPEWEVIPFEFNSEWVESLTQYQPITGNVDGPAVLRGSMILSLSEEVADTFIDMSSWTESRGIVFVNGFNLGRYSSIGPCKTLYVPAPLLKQGENKFHVFELYHARNDLAFSDVPNLGPVREPNNSRI